MKKMKRSSANRVLAAPYVVWMVTFIVVPLAVVLYYALTDPSTGELTLSNIAKIGNYMPILAESMWLAAIATFLCLLIAYPVAYTIAHAPARRQRALMLLVMLPMCMSFLLRTLAWVALLEDNGIINRIMGTIGLAPLKLIRTKGAVVLGMVYNYLPYMILPLYSVLTKIDRRVIEAAEDLGGNGKTVFTRVILPLSVPGIISGTTMVFVPAVSTFYISKKLGAGTVLIGDVIEEQFKSAYNPNLGAAMSLVLMLMIFISMGIMSRFTDSEEEA